MCVNHTEPAYALRYVAEDLLYEKVLNVKVEFSSKLPSHSESLLS